MNTAITVRALRFAAGVLRNQQHDPLCGNCKAWCNSGAALREKISRFASEHQSDPRIVPDGLAPLLSEAQAIVHGLVLPPNLSGQKKAGNCLLPTGVCFVKSSLAILEKV